MIQVSAIGYASVTKIVDLGNTYSVDIKLSASNYELSDVVVTALGNTTTRQRAPIPVTVVTHKIILGGCCEYINRPGCLATWRKRDY